MLEKKILSCLKGELLFQGVETNIFLPLSPLDLKCILNEDKNRIDIALINLQRENVIKFDSDGKIELV